MILYHFTDLFALQNAGPDAILAAGLKTHDPNEDYPMLNGKLRPCVWFTSEPELPPMFYKAGGKDARITVELSVASKRLVSWPKILRRANMLDYLTELERNKSIAVELGREPTDAELRAWRYWWVHFGDVPLKAIRAVEWADPKRRAEEGGNRMPAKAEPEP